jgi:hypothetical protein
VRKKLVQHILPTLLAILVQLSVLSAKDRGARTAATLCQSMYRERTYTEDGVEEELGQYLRFSICIRSAPDNAAYSAVGDTNTYTNYGRMEFLSSVT